MLGLCSSDVLPWDTESSNLNQLGVFNNIRNFSYPRYIVIASEMIAEMESTRIVSPSTAVGPRPFVSAMETSLPTRLIVYVLGRNNEVLSGLSTLHSFHQLLSLW